MKFVCENFICDVKNRSVDVFVLQSTQILHTYKHTYKWRSNCFLFMARGYERRTHESFSFKIANKILFYDPFNHTHISAIWLMPNDHT